MDRSDTETTSVTRWLSHIAIDCIGFKAKKVENLLDACTIRSWSQVSVTNRQPIWDLIKTSFSNIFASKSKFPMSFYTQVWIVESKVSAFILVHYSVHCFNSHWSSMSLRSWNTNKVREVPMKLRWKICHKIDIAHVEVLCIRELSWARIISGNFAFCIRMLKFICTFPKHFYNQLFTVCCSDTYSDIIRV